VVTLREALEIYRDPAFRRARSELLFLDLIKKAGLARPALNTFVAGYEIDAYWERERFAVEVDGWGAHRTRAANALFTAMRKEVRSEPEADQPSAAASLRR
jgi:hypothetical protein